MNDQTITIRNIFILSIIALTASFSGCGNKKVGTESTKNIEQGYEGIYTFGDTEKREEHHGEVYVYPGNDSTALFYLYVNKGAPAYNSGSIDGRIMLINGKGIFRKHIPYEDNDCILYFEFAGNTLSIKEDDTDCDCGFGFEVYADGTYLRTFFEIPKFYTTITNEKIFFSQWQEPEEIIEENDSALYYPRINSQFTSYFPNMILGKYNENMEIIPPNIIDRFLESMVDDDEKILSEDWYAVGKIEDLRGVDLFICAQVRNWFENWDRTYYTDTTRWLLFFKDGIALNEGPGYRFRYPLNLGWDNASSRTYYFDKDTTVIQYFNLVNNVENTGYEEPFSLFVKSREKVRDELDWYEFTDLLEVQQVEFSSSYYDRNFLDELQESVYYDEDNDKSYPTFENKKLLIDKYNSFHYQWAIFEDRIFLHFYVQKIDEKLIPIFETYDEGKNLIDRYYIGLQRNDEHKKRDYSARTKYLKCPVIIKTSDGDLELMPDGKLIIIK